MPELTLDWRPPSAAAGDVAALAEAIAAYPRVALLVDRSIEDEVDALDTMRLAALVGRLAPNTAVRPIAKGQGPQLSEVLREDPPLLPTVGSSGRTRWGLPGELELDGSALQSWAALGDPAVLMLGAVGVESPVWRQLATGSVGSCEPLFEALLDGQSSSLVELEPFLDHADALLERVYLEQLRAVLPTLSSELEQFEPERERHEFDAQGWERYQCGRSYLDYLRPFAACVEESQGAGQGCASAPRLYLQGVARVGSVEPSAYIRDDCPRRLGRDYVEELRVPARVATELVVDALDTRWMSLADRLATLADVHTALAQLCRPARRRFAETDLAQLREQVAELEQLFTRSEEPPHDARFLANDGSFHVPGLGRVRQLAHYDGGTGSTSRALSAAARELARFERAHSRCVAAPGDPPLMAMVVGTGDAAPRFLGFYYAEELWCDELGPL